MPLPNYSILGFNLSELRWSNFGARRLFESGWRWRRERVVLYQLTMLLTLTTEILATISLSSYSHLQSRISRAFPPTYTNQNPLIASQIALIVPSVWVSVVLGTEFFFLAQWPRRVWPKWWRVMMLAMMFGVTGALLAAGVAATIIVFTQRATLSRLPAGVTESDILAAYPSPPLDYSSYPLNIAYIVLSWVSWPFVVLSTILMYLAQRSDARYGPGPIHERQLALSSPISPSSPDSLPSAAPQGTFYWTSEADQFDAETELPGTPLSVSRSSDETAAEVGLAGGGELGVGQVKTTGSKSKLGMMMPGLERD